MNREKIHAVLPKINEVINAYFNSNSENQTIRAKDLMPHFIKAGVFEKDSKKGLPIRAILRELDRSNELHLIPTILPQRKKKNTFWFFTRQNY